MVQLKRKWKCPIKANHSCQTIYESTKKLMRHVAAYNANQTRKGRKPKIKSLKSKSKRRPKNGIRFQCPGTEKTHHKDGKWVTCTKKHYIASFCAAYKIALSEGIVVEYLKTKIGSLGFVCNTGTATGLLDVLVFYYSGKLEFHEIKPRDSGANGAQLLKPQQKNRVIESILNRILCNLWHYEEDNFDFSHSDPIKLTTSNIEKFSQPYNEEKAKALEKVSFKKLLNDKKMEKLSVDLTGHSVKIIRKMFKKLQK